MEAEAIKQKTTEAASKHLGEQFIEVTVVETPAGKEVTVQCRGPLPVFAVAEFGLELSEAYPDCKVLGPNFYENERLRFLI